MQRFLAQHSDKIAGVTIQVCINGWEYLARRLDRAEAKLFSTLLHLAAPAA